MEFKKGDRVRFLNEVGGGIVSKVLPRGMVHVMIEDGFEIPVMAKEIIKIEPLTAAERMFDKMEPLPSASSLPIDSPEEETVQKSSKLHQYLSPKKHDKGVYLAWVPHDQKFLLTGMLDIYCINYTSYDILYNLILTKPDIHGADYGSVESNSKALISTINREEMNHWTRGFLQVLFHPGENIAPKEPLHAEFEVQPARIISGDSYIHSSFIEEKALIIPIGFPNSIEFQRKPSIHQPPKAQLLKKIYFIDAYMMDAHTAEVDLHIEKIEDPSFSKESGDILKVQFDFYTRCLESALEKKIKRLFLIHGVGAGVLKSLIRGDLRQYTELSFTEAPYEKYGYGALQVDFSKS